MHKKNSWRMHKYRLRKRNNKNNSSNYLWQATANKKKKNITLPEPQPLTHRPRPRRRPLLAAAAANALQGRWTTTKTTKIQKQSHKSVTKGFVICSEFAQLFWTCCCCSYLLLHSIFPGDANLWASQWRDNGHDTTIPRYLVYMVQGKSVIAKLPLLLFLLFAVVFVAVNATPRNAFIFFFLLFPPSVVGLTTLLCYCKSQARRPRHARNSIVSVDDDDDDVRRCWRRQLKHKCQCVSRGARYAVLLLLLLLLFVCCFVVSQYKYLFAQFFVRLKVRSK